jgi:hypothetical protein
MEDIEEQPQRHNWRSDFNLRAQTWQDVDIKMKNRNESAKAL